MYYYPSTANEREVCLAHACNNDMPGAAILLLRLSGRDGFLALTKAVIILLATSQLSVGGFFFFFFLGYNRN